MTSATPAAATVRCPCCDNMLSLQIAILAWRRWRRQHSPVVVPPAAVAAGAASIPATPPPLVAAGRTAAAGVALVKGLAVRIPVTPPDEEPAAPMQKSPFASPTLQMKEESQQSPFLKPVVPPPKAAPAGAKRKVREVHPFAAVAPTTTGESAFAAAAVPPYPVSAVEPPPASKRRAAVGRERGAHAPWHKLAVAGRPTAIAEQTWREIMKVTHGNLTKKDPCYIKF